MPRIAGLPNISWATGLLFFLHCTLVNSSYCDSSVYGTIVERDCKFALHTLSFMSDPWNPKFQKPQIFAEPQFMDPPFRGLKNRDPPNPIVQLPKVWKYSMTSTC